MSRTQTRLRAARHEGGCTDHGDRTPRDEVRTTPTRSRSRRWSPPVECASRPEPESKRHQGSPDHHARLLADLSIPWPLLLQHAPCLDQPSACRSGRCRPLPAHEPTPTRFHLLLPARLPAGDRRRRQAERCGSLPHGAARCRASSIRRRPDESIAASRRARPRSYSSYRKGLLIDHLRYRRRDVVVPCGLARADRPAAGGRGSGVRERPDLRDGGEHKDDRRRRAATDRSASPHSLAAAARPASPEPGADMATAPGRSDGAWWVARRFPFGPTTGLANGLPCSGTGTAAARRTG